MTRTERTRWAKKRAQWARENSAYLHSLLSDREPGYLAALRSAERRVDRELTRTAAVIKDEASHDQHNSALPF